MTAAQLHSNSHAVMEYVLSVEMIELAPRFGEPDRLCAIKFPKYQKLTARIPTSKKFLRRVFPLWFAKLKQFFCGMPFADSPVVSIF